MTEFGYIFNGLHVISFFLIALMTAIMIGTNIMADKIQESFLWVIIISCFVLVIQDLVHAYAEMSVERYYLRLTMSVLGYVVRPVAVLGFLIVVWPYERSWYLWIPAALNAILYCTAFFSDIAFSIDTGNHFHRGPLGYTFIVVCLCYMVMILSVIFVRFRKQKEMYTTALLICAAGCLFTMIYDIQLDTITSIPALMVSVMYFYIFLRAQDTEHDPLTGLWNRMSFEEDCEKGAKSISVAVSIDMNGLKEINDEMGHDGGDRALQRIGRIMEENMNKNSSAYRIGGDEFVVLFEHSSLSEAENVIDKLVKAVDEDGLSISAGLATAEETSHNVEEMIRLSDQRMYAKKEEYYRRNGNRKPR